MAKQLKYISILCLLICAFLVGCGNTHEDTEQPGSDDNIIYAPVDPSADAQTSENDSDGVDATDDSDTADASDTTVSDDTEPAETTDDTEADTDQPDDTEPVDTPSVHAGVIMLGEDFSMGEHAVGSIVSRESEKIRLLVSYDCGMNEDGGITVALEVGLECYDINCGPRANGGTLSVNGEVYTFSTEAVVHEDAGMIYIPFETYIEQLDASEKSCTIEASWFFNGVYAGAKLDTLTAGATLDWSTNN